MMRKAPVIVLNMHYTGLGIARNLAALGMQVHAFGSGKDFAGNYSRHCRFRLAPDSRAEPEALRDFLIAFAAGLPEKPVLFPTRDHDIVFINRFRAELERIAIIPFAAPESIERALNKDKCYEAAVECGIDLPRSYTFETLAGLEAKRTELPFPCIAKPLYASQWRKPGIWELVGGQKVVRIADYGELHALYSRIVDLAPLLSVQELIPGPESNLAIFGSYTDRKGEVTHWFTGRKRLQYPQLYGTGVVVEGLPNPAIVDMSKRLLQRLGFFGISEIEYKLDERDGRYRLIEVNPRHWDQHRLGTAVGVNLTLAIYRDLMGDPLPPAPQRPEPVKWIADSDMFLHLLRCLFQPGHSLPECLGLLRGRKIWSVWDAGDLSPSFHLAAITLKGLWGMVTATVAKKLGGKTPS